MCLPFVVHLPHWLGVKPRDPHLQGGRVCVCGYQQWLNSEPGGYAFRERNSITGKWPVIETIPGIPKPTLHQCCSWHRLAFRYYRLLLEIAGVKYNAYPNISFHWWFAMWHVQRSPEFQSVHSQLLSPSPSGWKTLDSGHHMFRGTHGWALEDRLRQACATKPQAVFKTVSVRLKLFPLRRSCGVVWTEQVAGFLLSVCLSGWLRDW